MKGITLEIPPEVAEELRNRRNNNNNNKPLNRDAAEPRRGHDGDDGDEVVRFGDGLEFLSARPVVLSEQEDWECVIAPRARSKELVPQQLVVASSSETAEFSDEVVVVPQPHAHHPDADEQQQPQDDDDDDDNSSTLSYTLPFSLPVVLVDVERLTGYIPDTDADASRLQETVRAALWGEEQQQPERNKREEDKKEEEDECADEEQMIILARDFEERVTELFASGMARHGSTDDGRLQEEWLCALNKPQKFMPVDYPEYLCRGTTALLTARVWKKLLQPHAIPVVDRLLRSHLAHCSRSLLWKYDMMQCIRHLAKNEEEEAVRRQQEQELALWRSGYRKEQLEKLYAVRDTLAERLEQAKAKQQQHEDDRDRTVKQELRKRRILQQELSLTGGGGGGLEAFDFESTAFAFPPEQDSSGMSLFLGLKEDEDDNNYYPALLSDDEYGNDNNEHSDEDDRSYGVDNDGEEGKEEAGAGNEAASCKPKLLSSPKERRKTAAQTRRQRLGEKAKEAEHRAKLEAAFCEEDRVREMCTTQDLLVAMAVVNSLERKLQQVDELLESLQEEQWTDEEAESSTDEWLKSTSSAANGNESHQATASLLDQVLSAILGACPPPPDGTASLDQHVQYLENEHESILAEWEEHFGRLPPLPVLTSSYPEEGSTSPPAPTTASAPSASSTTPRIHHNTTTAFAKLQGPPEEMRRSLGIIDNGEENWDASDDDDDEEQASSTVEVPVAGLRPGGRVRR